MKKRISILAAALLITALLVPLITGCATEDEKDTATQIAKDWMADNTAAAADEITDLATGITLGVTGIPGISDVLSSAVEQKISDSITWTYSTPLKIGDNKYEIVAKAIAYIDLPVVGNYKVSVDFPLIIDTENEEVTDWSIDAGSFHFTDIGPGPAASSYVEFDGWYVENSKVTTAGKSDIVTAKLTLSISDAGTYTLRILRDISWANDETVTDLSFDYEGDSVTKEVSFIPPYATGESSTNGYFVNLLQGDITIWTMTNDYPPRLTVSS